MPFIAYYIVLHVVFHCRFCILIMSHLLDVEGHRTQIHGCTLLWLISLDVGYNILLNMHCIKIHATHCKLLFCVHEFVYMHKHTCICPCTCMQIPAGTIGEPSESTDA